MHAVESPHPWLDVSHFRDFIDPSIASIASLSKACLGVALRISVTVDEWCVIGAESESG